PCPSPPLLIAQPIAAVAVMGDLGGLLEAALTSLGLLTRRGHEPLLAGLTLGLPLLIEDVRRDRLEPGLLEAPGQPELVLVVVGDVGPHAEDVAALDLHPVVTGGLLELLERAIGELDVPELHALGRLPLIEAETVVPVGNIGASPQLEVHEPGLLATLTSYQLQTLAVDAGEAVDLHVLMLLPRLGRRRGRLLRARCRVRPRCRLLLAVRGLRSALGDRGGHDRPRGRFRGLHGLLGDRRGRRHLLLALIGRPLPATARCGLEVFALGLGRLAGARTRSSAA